MKNTKKKVLVIALAVCMLAIMSFGTLAWFNAKDSVTNEFFIANSADDPDEIFSVDVWEDATADDPDGEPKIQDGIEFDDILPGDDLYKEVHIENTGSYPQYVRATVTVSDASVWQEVYGEYVVALADIVNGLDENAIHTHVAYYDAATDSFVYELYYTAPLAVDAQYVVFESVSIPESLDRLQAADLAGSFTISVVADAVQTENVGANVYEAFKTVGLVKAIAISDPADLAAALASEDEAYLVINETALNNGTLDIDSAIKNKTLDFNGLNAVVTFSANASAENVVITGIVDTDGTVPSIQTNSAFTGDLTVNNCSFIDAAGQPYGAAVFAGGNITVDDCQFEGIGKSYAIYSTQSNGDITVTDSSFKNLGSWAIQINGKANGDVTIDNCVFETPDGVLKILSGVDGDFTFTNNTMVGVKGHDANPDKILVSGSGSGPVSATGIKTVTGNTLDGNAWTQA